MTDKQLDKPSAARRRNSTTGSVSETAVSKPSVPKSPRQPRSSESVGLENTRNLSTPERKPNRSTSNRAVTNKADARGKGDPEKAAPAKSKATPRRSKAGLDPIPAPGLQISKIKRPWYFRLLLWVFRLLWRLIPVRFRSPLYVFAGIIVFVIGFGLIRSALNYSPPPIASFFTPEVQYWAPKIKEWGALYGVDPNLIATIMQIESCGLPGANSSVGAQGLFQVMPMHFSDAEKDSMTDPDINAKRGMTVIKECLDYADGDAGKALACYNGGPGLISRSIGTWPGESQRYYAWGSAIYADATRKLSSSSALDSWLNAGGLLLCRQAATSLGIATSTVSPVTVVASTGTPLPTPTTIPLLPTTTGGEYLVPTINPNAPLPTFDAKRK